MSTTTTKMLLITGCKDPMRWYSGMVGQMVPFIKDVGTEYQSREPEGHINFVQKDECMVVDASQITK